MPRSKQEILSTSPKTSSATTREAISVQVQPASNVQYVGPNFGPMIRSTKVRFRRGYIISFGPDPTLNGHFRSAYGIRMPS